MGEIEGARYLHFPDRPVRRSMSDRSVDAERFVHGNSPILIHLRSSLKTTVRDDRLDDVSTIASSMNPRLRCLDENAGVRGHRWMIGSRRGHSRR